ncbi:DASS family sodium-coupled anion symporter [Kocuria palustris]|jgi:sodium-dependent dicarboxylate transporter 2/3/5|uniref:Sodium-dependent dicarboxylate transporter SdcS n=1 Tax=Kocuria palustris PEL TaxID=1236550 RepID=M2WGB9_9MICC|nr:MULTISPECIES: DASS family sodium-coupled anion symporter [Kocuria]EME37597.1 di- and tricarboxylate transporter [Kocuria palustris PEL]MBN6754094.1 DASS family sodium-coupled anion symporter [Kocuria palustris]MBN6759023.1 DASS family sodium-coupled anion symporter [Kocuria palustris]MBN6764197.1 DASS family sodium-coupled anion symporter [Kocuria palustris]MBN6783635.1 DASS family sodium-coupled anion symporter [Kocuria palustris]
MPNLPWSAPGPNDDAHPDHPRGGSTPVGHKVPGDHLIGQEADPRRNEEIDQLSPGQREPAKPTRTVQIQWLGLAVGLVLGILVYLAMPGDVPQEARLTAATAVLMAVWWMTEALPIPATALVPLIVFPTLGSTPLDDVGASYGNNVIFLFMGGFLLALAMQRWNLHRRMALLTVRLIGTRPPQMIAGFMIATGFLSMWVSNTATAVMMLPIGISVLLLVNKTSDAIDDPVDADEDAAATPVKSNFGTALMLGIAYAASIGSLGTIIGTPPNTLLVGYMASEHDVQIGFGQWMIVGVPLAVVLMAACWFLLTKVLFKPEIDEIPGGRKLIDDELAKLGTTSAGERRVLVIFVLAALAWVFVPLVTDWVGADTPPITDAGIAMAVGVLLFLLPAGAARGVRLLDWDSALKLPWGVLLLFGGGLALSAQFSSSGLTEWIGEVASGLGGLPVVLLVVLFAAGILFLTELTSNTATAATFLPVAGGIAMGMGMDPLLLAIPVALAATCAFMLPVATPPNAIAYGSGYVSIPQMIKGGIWLNLIGLVLNTAVTMTLAVWVFGIAF